MYQFDTDGNTTNDHDYLRVIPDELISDEMVAAAEDIKSDILKSLPPSRCVQQQLCPQSKSATRTNDNTYMVVIDDSDTHNQCVEADGPAYLTAIDDSDMPSRCVKQEQHQKENFFTAAYDNMPTDTYDNMRMHPKHLGSLLHRSELPVSFVELLSLTWGLSGYGWLLLGAGD